MKVILTKDVPSLGRAGDIKEVSDGHARNFLIPKHLALPATTEILAQVQKEEQERQTKILKDTERFAVLKNKLEGKTFTIHARATKNNLFAAIHEKEIAQVINDKTGGEISPSAIVLEKPVKRLGLHEIQIRFAKNVSALVKLNVEQA
jgi:large subunit ribosomal protein L9